MLKIEMTNEKRECSNCFGYGAFDISTGKYKLLSCHLCGSLHRETINEFYDNKHYFYIKMSMVNKMKLKILFLLKMIF